LPGEAIGQAFKASVIVAANGVVGAADQDADERGGQRFRLGIVGGPNRDAQISQAFRGREFLSLE
jgi:hypothetical protein